MNATAVEEHRACSKCALHYPRRVPELRPYQNEAAEAILRSALNGRGLTFTVVMARQAGKNELSAKSRWQAAD